MKALWLLPSFYGLAAWLVTLLLLISDVVYVKNISVEGWFVIGYVLSIFIVMTAVSLGKASYLLKGSSAIEVNRSDWVIFVITSILGIAGLVKYVYDFSLEFGSVQEFLFVLLTSPLEIRMAAQETQSIGFQLSYFSWISIFFGLFFLSKTRMILFKRAIIFFTVILEVLLNLTFIDRTRPTWLLVVCVLGISFSGGVQDLKIRRALLYISGIPVVLFVVFSWVVGKYDVDEGILNTLFVYVVGGFGYLDSLILAQESCDYLPVRTLYPISKILEGIGLLDAVPSQILEFRFVPFETNVGTFIEPLISDGGIVYVLLGVPLVVFVVNYISLRAFSTRSMFGMFVWGNLIFSMIISFFVPKFNSTPIYLFCSLFAVLQIVAIKKYTYRA